jgi:phage terminase large subunit-like protein
VALTDDLRVAEVVVRQGNDAVLEITEAFRQLAERFTVRGVYFDPWRRKGEARRLETEGIGPMIEWPQSHQRLVPASERLHAAITEGRLRHPGHPDLVCHVASAIAVPTGRGWRIDKAHHEAQIDAVVALMAALEGAERQPRRDQAGGLALTKWHLLLSALAPPVA